MLRLNLCDVSKTSVLIKKNLHFSVESTSPTNVKTLT